MSLQVNILNSKNVKKLLNWLHLSTLRPYSHLKQNISSSNMLQQLKKWWLIKEVSKAQECNLLC